MIASNATVALMSESTSVINVVTAWVLCLLGVTIAFGGFTLRKVNPMTGLIFAVGGGLVTFIVAANLVLHQFAA